MERSLFIAGVGTEICLIQKKSDPTLETRNCFLLNHNVYLNYLKYLKCLSHVWRSYIFVIFEYS